ncbi:MFS transporter [Streptomyces sp. JJ66]|uniref:MFS transporter n=1 Tax=Streptomyces sp. JJ66 TaxID=2803843 RepID=UPI00214BBB5B|nr:MFS transporter [Streptomyces sp. JJ66]
MTDPALRDEPPAPALAPAPAALAPAPLPEDTPAGHAPADVAPARHTSADVAPAGDRPSDVPPVGPDTAPLGRGLLLLMAVATGLSCAGNYFAQPLLDLIRSELNVSTAVAGLVVTAGQAGYALGLLALIPLGDVLDRRRLAVTLFSATAGFLALTALATSGALLLAGTVLTALTSVGAQVVVAHAAALATPADRGRVVATVMSGLLLGGLLARTAAGGLAELGGWQTVYWVNAVLMAGMAALLHRHLPRLRPTAALGYPALLRSTFTLLRQERLLRWRTAVGACSMASYSVQLTAVTFVLAGPGYAWSEATIGLFGLVGVVGVLTMKLAGRLGDTGSVHQVTGVALVLLVAAWLTLLPGAGSLGWLVVGIVALNVAQQAVLNSSQTILYALRPEARNRINSAFMTGYFVGGAAGSALASVVWVHAGWRGACTLGATLAAASTLLWLAERLGPRAPKLPSGA